jgi:hypothetical protein
MGRDQAIRVTEMNAFVVSGLIKRRAELAGDIEKAHEALRKMVLGDERNLKPGSGRNLADALVEHGFIRKRAHGGVRGFCNLVLRSDYAGLGDAG